MSALDDTGICPQCGGDLTPTEDLTMWQCTRETCTQPPIPVTEEDRILMSGLRSAGELWEQYFSPEALGPPPAIPDPGPKPESVPRRRWPFGRGS